MADKPTDVETTLAQAFHGPYNFNGIFDKTGSQKYTLEEVRAAKWSHMTGAEQMRMINGLRSIKRQLKNNPELKEQFLKEIENYHD